MAKPKYIQIPAGEQIQILFEDRSVMAIDKPAGWLLAPSTWQNTGRNLQTALVADIHAGAFWARSRNLKYLRFVHRLDADTSGVLLLGKSPGAVTAYSALFESRLMEKTYLAVILGRPRQNEWECRHKLACDPARVGKMKVDPKHGKDAQTRFHVVLANDAFTLVEARPLTGRTHQIRIHLAASGHPIQGDRLYGKAFTPDNEPLALRAVCLAFVDPFTRRRVSITAPSDEFTRRYGFSLAPLPVEHISTR